MDSFSPPPLTPMKPWYKERAAKIFLGVISAILSIGILFGSFVGYYVWQIRVHGITPKAAPLTYQGKQSRLAEAKSTNGTVPQDLSQFIHTYNPTHGDASAPITIIAFIDFECPYCQADYAGFRRIMDQYGPAVRVVFKHLPISAIHPNSIEAALASTCAKEQERFWDYYALLFEQKKLDSDSLVRYAESLGFNIDRFTSCLRSQKYSRDIDTDLADAATLGLKGTPTYFVNQTKIEGVVDKTVWDTVILAELKKQTSR